MKFDFSPSGLLQISHLKLTWLWLGMGFLLIVLIFLGSILNISIELPSFALQDKVMHMTAYACLMGWFAQIYRHDLTRLILVLSFIAMGIMIEVLQSMTATRQFEFLDMLANTSGVVLAWALAYTWVGGLLAKFEKIIGFGHSAEA